MFKFNEKTCDKIFVCVYIVCFCIVSIYMYSGKSQEENLKENIQESSIEFIKIDEENKVIVEGNEIKEGNKMNEENKFDEENKIKKGNKINEENKIQEGNKINEGNNIINEENKMITDENISTNPFWIFLENFIENKTKCFFKEEDKSKQPMENKMVIHISILLLQTSLIWTIVDFVDRYLKRGKKKVEKARLNRTCSLADMTLMRHQRRESMRRDHSLDVNHGRFPARTFVSGNNVNRRCSLPVGPKEHNVVAARKESIDISNLLNRRMTINTTDTPTTFEHKRSHVRLIHRH